MQDDQPHEESRQGMGERACRSLPNVATPGGCICKARAHAQRSQNIPTEASGAVKAEIMKALGTNREQKYVHAFAVFVPVVRGGLVECSIVVIDPFSSPVAVAEL
jgi:hypothetical protein